MIALKGQNEDKISYLFEKFLSEYAHLYSHDALDFIKENFWTYLYSKCAPDILMEIYGEIGIEPSTGNFYNAHLAKLEQLFGIDHNILEVASGMIPTFANKIAHQQLNLKKGTITIYEPLLLKTTSKYPNMTIHRERFTTSTDVHSYDLITGILTCDATENIITSACQNRKDFYIAMCGCCHLQSSSPFISVTARQYQKYIIQKATELLHKYENGTLQVDYLDSSYELNYPILYNRH